MSRFEDLAKAQTYTTPKFEEKTRTTVIKDGDKAWKVVEDLRAQINNAMHVVSLWDDLYNELTAHKVEKVSQLPADRIAYWKGLLETKFVSMQVFQKIETND